MLYTGVLLGGHVRAVFTLVTFIFIACVIITLYSFSEIPLDVLADVSNIDLAKVSTVACFFLMFYSLSPSVLEQ